MTATLASLNWLFKHVYSNDAIINQAARTHYVVDRIAKRNKMKGRTGKYEYKVKYGNPQGIAATITAARTAAGGTATKGVEFSATRKKRYALILVDGEADAAAAGEGAQTHHALWQQELDNQIEELGDTCSFDVFRDGNGIRGRRSSAATNVITMTDAEDVRNFKVDMVVGASANADGSSPRTGTTTVTAIDEDLGTVTLASAAAITSFANNDYMFRSGDPGTCIEGFGSIFTHTRPALGTDSFRGQDRAVDWRRLAGILESNTDGVNTEYAFGLAAKKMYKTTDPGQVSGVCSPDAFYEIQNRLNAQVVRNDSGGKTQIGHPMMCINAGGLALDIYQDSDCPNNRGYILDWNSMYWGTLMDWVHVITADGNVRLRTVDDELEIRLRQMGNLIVTAPGHNATIVVV